MMEMCGWFIVKMSQNVKIGGVWKSAIPYLKVGGSWKVPKSVNNKINGVWKNSFLQGGLRDTEFAPVSASVSLDNTIYSTEIQPDGKIVFGGFFTTFNGVTVNRIARINSDGTLDTAFAANTGTGANLGVNSVALQSDGKIVVAGSFTSWNGTMVNRIVRLNSDGTLDTAFVSNVGGGFNSSPSSIAIQSDGSMVIVGSFTTFRGVTVNRIVRLDSSGSRDTSFTTNTGTAFNDNLWSVAIQSDGKIVVGGLFTSFNGVTISCIVRLNSNGTLDTAFRTNTGTGTNGAIYSIAIQSDGKILIGGDFQEFNGVEVNRIARINSDGTRDTFFNFSLGDPNDRILEIALQSDGSIIVGGWFTTWSIFSAVRIARISSSGILDLSFLTNIGTGFNSDVNSIKIQSDDKIIVAGNFTTFNGSTASRIARLGGDFAG